jgi:hypothetical protein
VIKEGIELTPICLLRHSSQAVLALIFAAVPETAVIAVSFVIKRFLQKSRREILG